jgi:hypothetical protein
LDLASFHVQSPQFVCHSNRETVIREWNNIQKIEQGDLILKNSIQQKDGKDDDEMTFSPLESIVAYAFSEFQSLQT